MNGISELRKRSNKFISDLESWKKLSVDESGKEFVQLNREQMLNSKDSTGKNITPKYSNAYSLKKGFTNPNLFLKGDFQGDMVHQIRGSEIDISSSDFKMPFLVARYGDDIFGISPQNNPKASDIATKQLMKHYNREVI